MKQHCLLKLALVLAISAWTVKGATLGRPAAPAKAGPTITLTPQLKAFVKAKEAQARADTQAAGDTVSPDVWAYFAAAGQGKWDETSRLWASLAERCGQYASSTNRKSGTDLSVRNAAWQPLLEVDLAVRAFAYGEPKFAEAFGLGIIESIPPGALYFGGTDPGRGLVTALCKSHVNGEPFFTLTQNALADGTYLAYLRRMYGSKLYIPTAEDSEKTFNDYLSDAQRRLEHARRASREPKQLKPGEDVRMKDNTVEVSGQVAVMSINALLTKIIFDKNPEREFYLEESFPLDWMFPHLTPHGLIMKINRQPLAALPENDVLQDRTFWTKQVQRYLGDWLTYDTPVTKVCAFVEQVFGEKEPGSFHCDPQFVKDDDACREFSKLRSSIAGVYAWRLNNTKAGADRERMANEADFAFRQAFALCPYSPEALYRYVNLLLTRGRADDALTLAETAHKLDPDNAQVEQFRQQVARMAAQKSH